MRIDTSRCAPRDCQYECADACQNIHGEKSPLEVEEKSLLPVIDQARCTRCLACARACPFDAILIDNRAEKSASQRSVFLSDDRDIAVYETSSRLKRFPESDMVFARVHNDPTFQNYRKSEFFGADEMISRQISGYSRFEHELTKAAWEYYEKRKIIEQDSTGTKRGTRRQASPSTLTSMVKRAAKFLGADLVGITQIDQRWIYSTDREGNTYDIPDGIEYAIVVAIEMNYDAIATSPSFTSSAETGLGYSRMAFLETEVSAFLRRLGYRAVPCGNDIALSVPLAIDAGLGQYGRHGLLITREYGPRVRLAKVLTDMPLVPSRIDTRFCEAVTRFCEVCGKCAEMCPSQSIPYERERTWTGQSKSNNPGAKKWYVDVESCYNFWIQNGCDCSNCIRSCPFNKRNGWLHKTVTFIVERFQWLHRLILAFDDMLGFGRQKRTDEFWRRL